MFALTNNERFGVWGGTSETTRKAIRRKYPATKGKPNPNWKWMTEQEALEGLTKEDLEEDWEQD